MASAKCIRGRHVVAIRSRACLYRDMIDFAEMRWREGGTATRR
jgi:hypothetical protein